MFISTKEIKLFYKGASHFNDNQYEEAHRLWELLWKKIGNEPRRLGLKIFLQLTGIHQNCLLQKWDSVRYLIKTSSRLVNENRNTLEAYIEVKSIERFLTIYRDKEVTLKALDEVIIKRNGVEFTKTSELNEHLPLPHTKGTKPAP
jgi:hypothetical protein